MASNPNGVPGPRIRWRVAWAIPAALLTIPWLAGWPWTAADFIVAGAMFTIVGGAFELAMHASGNASYRWGSAVALATALLLVWINLAVGIIGSEDNPLNLMFFGVIAVALIGSVAVRFRSAGIAAAMTAAGIVQAMIGAGAFAFRSGATDPPGAWGLLGLIEFFAIGWFLSAWLFRNASKGESR